ncbi:MAG: hypothetical protein K2Y15_03050 [Burkholderiaceae bacterium]|nr:hypothetical protein [Burkholderiaceae bacterium]
MSDRHFQSLLVRALLGIVVSIGLFGCASAPVHTGLPPAEAMKLAESLAGKVRPDGVALNSRYLKIHVQQSRDHNRWTCNKSLMVVTSVAWQIEFGEDNSFTGRAAADGDCRSPAQWRFAGRYNKDFVYIYYPDDASTAVEQYKILHKGVFMFPVDGVEIPEGSLGYRGLYKYNKDKVPTFLPFDNNPNYQPTYVIFNTELQPIADDPFAQAARFRRLYTTSFGAAAAEAARQSMQARRETQEAMRQTDRAWVNQMAQNSQPAFVSTQQQVQQQLNRQAEINREQLRMAPPPAPPSVPATKPVAPTAAVTVQRPATPTVTPGVATMTYAAGTHPGRPANSDAAAGDNSRGQPSPPTSGTPPSAGSTASPKAQAGNSGGADAKTRNADKGNSNGTQVANAGTPAETPKAKRELQYERQNVTITAAWKQCEYSRDSAKQWAETSLGSEAIQGCYKLGKGWNYEKMSFGGYEQARACKDGKSWGYLIENAIATCRKLVN